MEQALLPAYKSGGFQGRSELRVVRLIYTIGRAESSGCSSLSVAPKPSTQASQYVWKGREPLVTASQSRKLEMDGVETSA